jgi:hypothetical protein
MKHMVAYDSVVAEAVCYKLDGRGFDTRWGEWIFSIYLILPATLGLEFTQPLTERRTGSRKVMFWGSVERPVRKAGKLVAICEPTV